MLSLIIVIIILCLNYIKYFEILQYKNYLDIVNEKYYLNIKFKNDDYNKHKKYIDTVLYKNIKSFCNNSDIQELIYYSVKNGKRIRSVIISSIYESYYNINIEDVNNDHIGKLISSIEYTQSATLVLDDIMDHDTYRRDELCMYIKYGFNKTQLTALMLLSRSYYNINMTIIDLFNKYNLGDKDEKMKYTKDIYSTLLENFEKCSIGQYLDLYGDDNMIDDVLMNKTVTLFEIPYLLIWLYILWDRPEYVSSEN